MKTKHFRGFRPQRRRFLPIFGVPIVVAVFALVMQPIVNYFDTSLKEFRVAATGNDSGPSSRGAQGVHTPATVVIRQPHRGYEGPGSGTERKPDERVPASSVVGTPVLPGGSPALPGGTPVLPSAAK